MKHKVKKAVSKSMREKAEEALNELKNCPNGILKPVKGLKKSRWWKMYETK